MATLPKDKPTKEEFAAYVRVQKSGAYNMLDPRAVRATGLDDGTYNYILCYYDELVEEYGE